jgi:streptogramin lyase
MVPRESRICRLRYIGFCILLFWVLAGILAPLAFADNSSATFTPVSGMVNSMVADGSGNLWFGGANTTDGSLNPGGMVGEIDSSGALIQQSFPSEITSLAIAPDGTIWYARAGGWIGYLNGLTVGAEWSIPNLPGTSGGGETSLAFGSNGEVWFTEQSPQTNGSTICGVGELDGAGQSMIVYQPTDIYCPSSIAEGPDGNIWAASGARLDIISPSGSVDDIPVPQTGSCYSLASITSGPGGTMWAIGDNGVVSMAAGGTFTNCFPVSFPRSDIAACPNGNVYYTIMNPDFLNFVTPGGTESLLNFGVGTGNTDNVTCGAQGTVWFTAATISTGANSIGEVSTQPPAEVPESSWPIAFPALTALIGLGFWLSRRHLGHSTC